jgi:two-component system sensor histidine kinase KdpD
MSLRFESDLSDAGSWLGRWAWPAIASLALIGAVTALLWALQAPPKHDHLIFVCLVPSALIAVRYGSVSAMGVTLVSGLAAAYWIYAPRFSFLIANPLDVMELILFSLLALLASQVVSGFAADRTAALRQARDWGWIARLRRGVDR